MAGQHENGGKYAAVIRKARKDAGLNQQQLADRLQLSRNTVAGWETGHSRPDLDLVPAVCKALGISLSAFFGTREALSLQERKLLTLLRKLDESDRLAMLFQAEGLVSGRRALRDEAEQLAARIDLLRRNTVRIYRSDLSAAAGFGGTLENERGERIWLHRDAMTEQADEIITVNGRSMEPTFLDGEQVLIQHTDRLREGEIGVFVTDGEGYIKEYRKDGLHSHNPEYPVMRFGEGSEVRCMGRVLGKVQDSQRLSEEELKWMEEA